jgi:hypothetical protein
MGPFIAGAIMGLAFAGALAVIIFTRRPKSFGFHRGQSDDLLPWTEEYHQQPQVTTTILVKKREIQL